LDYSKKENWTIEILERTLEYHTILCPEERGNFELLWKAKMDCEEVMGIIIRPID